MRNEIVLQKEEYNLFKVDSGFYFTPANWKQYRIGFAFDSSGLKDFYYGICRIDWNIGMTKDEIERQTPKLSFMNDGANDKWPRCKYFESEYRNWDNKLVWEAIDNGEMKKLIKSKVEEILNNTNGTEL